jgi:hypothetical protein
VWQYFIAKKKKFSELWGRETSIDNRE